MLYTGESKEQLRCPGKPAQGAAESTSILRGLCSLKQQGGQGMGTTGGTGTAGNVSSGLGTASVQVSAGTAGERDIKQGAW